MNHFHVHRVLSAPEIDEIRRLQADDPNLQFHYPHHQAWLRRALDEVQKGTRLAFGVFSSQLDAFGRSKIVLVGAAILKPERYARVVEMKNLFIAPEHRHRSAGKTLYS